MEGVPYLRNGKGSRPQDGGCILQVIDWIDRGQWSDTPRCVLGPFRELAINCNDSLPDDERQQLLDLAPRLRGTAHTALYDRAGNVIRALTPEQEEFNKRASHWVQGWMSSHPAGDREDEYSYDYIRRLRDALDAFEQKFGKQKPMWFTEIDWQPIYNYLRNFELTVPAHEREEMQLTRSA